MDPQQTPSSPNVAPNPQPTIEQIAAQRASAPNLQPTTPPTAESLTGQVEAAPAPATTTVDPNAQSDAVNSSLLSPPPPAQVVHTGSVQGRALQAQDLASLSASDDDLIEKEWVDTVDQVIEKDEDDPLTEDIDHNIVSRAYQKQRFNLDVS
ncbi:MAG: hypothetical protein U0516_03950 [Candidatus Saccharibacteria bacterium]